MTEAFDAYLDAARLRLSEARTILELGIPRVASREAYLAAFNAAQAFVLNRTGKVAKTHSGVRAEFARLSRGEPELDPQISKLLASGYQQKIVADYGDAILESPISRKMAAEMIARAAAAIEQIGTCLVKTKKS